MFLTWVAGSPSSSLSGLGFLLKNYKIKIFKTLKHMVSGFWDTLIESFDF